MGYRTYSQQDFTTFQKSYSNNSKPPDWFTRDFGKPNETISTHAVFSAKLSSAWMRVNNTKKDRSTTFLLTSRIVDNSGNTAFAHREYGAPEIFVTKLVVRHHAEAGSAGVEATIWSVNKTSTRLPETMFISFTPDTETDGAKADPLWEMKKLGQWQKTEGDVVAGGSKHLHGIGIGGGFRFSKTGADGAARYLEIEAMDAPVINLGEPLGFPIPCEELEDPWDVEPDLDTFGVSSVFWNNLWGTNYVQWYPFNRNYVPVAGEEIFISRYNLRFDVGESPASTSLFV